MLKVLFVLGTRPEVIKFAPVIRHMQEDDFFLPIVCFTGQHKEMLYQTADFFRIKPDYSLELMTPNQTLVGFLTKSLGALDEVIKLELPDLVFVQGDTSTVLAGSLAAFYNKTKLAHLEAGLRSFDKFSPFPEEINRVLCSRIADYHFAPTPLAAKHLEAEGIQSQIYMVGNTVIDALFLCLNIIRQSGDVLYKAFFKDIDFSKKIILITCHRRENFGDPLLNIVEAIRSFAELNHDIQLVFPVHLNPKIKEVVYKKLGDLSNVFLLSPLDYPHLVWIMNQADFVVTDSGGIQEEASALGKYVIVMREVTERIESVEAGTAVLVGSDKVKILQNMIKLATTHPDNHRLSGHSPYGNGRSAEAILEILKNLN
jgi:UDP-N-acetylglucosamine 2-epimerase (non-hydrolysing)